MMLTEREKEIALKIAHDMPEGFLWWEDCGWEAGVLQEEIVQFASLLLSRIREEQDAVGRIVEGEGYALEAEFGKGSYLIGSKLFTTPPAAPFCPRQLADGGMSSTAVVCGDSFSSDVLIKKIQESAAPCDCKELVEALERIASEELYGNGKAQYRMSATAKEALANHAKRMKEGAK